MNQLAKRNEDVSDNQLAAASLGTGATMQRISTPYVTAVMVQKPRDYKQLAQNAVKEAELMGEEFFYSWDVKEKDRHTGELKLREIVGISHDGALALMRHWGNCAYDPQLQTETDSKWTVAVSFVDYEAGITTPRLMQITKEKPLGKYSADRWLDMLFQNGQSRAIRNAILAGLPGWLKNKCLRAARTAAEKNLTRKPDQLQLERDQLIKDAKSLGLTGAHLKSKMHKRIDDYSAKDIVTMRAILRSIQEGDATVEQIFDIEAPAARQSDRGRNGNGRNGRNGRNGNGHQRPAEQPQEEPKQHQIFAHSMAKAQSLDELESIAQQVGQAHQAGDISDDERDALTEVYTSRKARLTASA